MTIVLVSCNRPPDYADIIGRSPQYYADIAKACDELLRQTNHVANELLFNGTENSLPASLRNLHATSIKVIPAREDGIKQKPYVWIRIGDSRPGFGITWEQNDHGNRPWELSINADGKRTVVYSVQESSSSMP